MSRPIRTIGIFSPSSRIIQDRFDRGCSLLRERGYNLVIHPQTYLGDDPSKQPTGSTQEKLEAFKNLTANPEIDLIMAATGGNRACFLLPEILDVPTQKPLMGFSDITMLLSSFYSKGQRNGFFGPGVQTLQKLTTADIDLTFSIANGTFKGPHLLKETTPIIKGEVTAPVFAATLAVLCALAGTPYFPDLNGHILVLEDIGEETSAIDRMLWQLFRIVKPAGLVFGRFSDVQDTGRPYGESLEEILAKHAKSLSCPAVFNAPIGHDGQIFAIPQGRKITLDATNRSLIF